MITLEEKLLELAIEANKKINIKNVNEREIDETNKAGCSIFLKDLDYGDNRYTLRANTNVDFYLGLGHLLIDKEVRKKYSEKDYRKMGLTICAILEKKGVFTPFAITDPRWSDFERFHEEIVKGEQTQYCEYSYKELGGLIAVPIIDKKKDVLGVIRIVNKKDNQIKYGEEDLKKLEEFIKKEIPLIESMVSYGELLEIGSVLSLRDLCHKATKVINSILGGKGCSIFLLDEKESTKWRKIYRCFGTTGLAYKDEKGKIQSINDPYENARTTYSYEPKELEGKKRPILSMTVAVIHARENAFIDDMHNQDEIDKQFTPPYKIIRKAGTGQSCEYALVQDRYISSKSILYAPIFYREKTTRDTDVLGVIRIARPEGSVPFNPEQKHFFISLAEKLSKTIINAKYVELLNELAKSRNTKELFLMVVDGIPKIIGGSIDCAILIKDGSKLKKAAEWRGGKSKFYEKGDISSSDSGYFEYDISDSSTSQDRGYTGWVAYYGRPLRFNSPEEAKKISPRAEHNSKSGEPPDRVLGVPILKKEEKREVFGVIRICKKVKETIFTENDEVILSQIAQRVLAEVERFQRTKELIDLAGRVYHEVSPLFPPLNGYLKKGMVKEALRVGKKIEVLINDMKNFVKGIKGLNFSPSKITPLLEDILKDNKKKMKSKGITWVINKPDSEREIIIDYEKIDIVFRNLISNAIDAIVMKDEKEGKITITVGEDENKGMVKIIFEDDGCGMKQEVQDKLFKEYVSIKQEGLGIGLSLSNSIIKDHQGLITFESKYDKGSKFVVELPFHQEKDKKEE
ncbi:MAG: GAF domain-containing sensor histidine kinase [bacterium]|nr:GAF domain-containing sensor histidine kinase [bacterium]